MILGYCSVKKLLLIIDLDGNQGSVVRKRLRFNKGRDKNQVTLLATENKNSSVCMM
jgi:hypothetical protein